MPKCLVNRCYYERIYILLRYDNDYVDDDENEMRNKKTPGCHFCLHTIEDIIFCISIVMLYFWDVVIHNCSNFALWDPNKILLLVFEVACDCMSWMFDIIYFFGCKKTFKKKSFDAELRVMQAA